MSYIDRSETRAYSAGTIGALAAGYLMSRVIGAVAWIPAILGGASFVLLKKIVDRNVAVVATLAAIIAQTGWFAVGIIAVPAEAAGAVPDIAINLLLLAIIYFKPGYVTAGLAILWNGLGIAMVGYRLAMAPEGAGDALMTVEQRALIAHIALRAIIIAAAAMIMIFKANPELLPDETDDEDEEAIAGY